MLETVYAADAPPMNRSFFNGLVRRSKRAVQEFNDDEDGLNTVEAIILLFVAAVVLLVFFTLIWPLIRDAVMEKLNELFGQTG